MNHWPTFLHYYPSVRRQQYILILQLLFISSIFPFFIKRVCIMDKSTFPDQIKTTDPLFWVTKHSTNLVNVEIPSSSRQQEHFIPMLHTDWYVPLPARGLYAYLGQKGSSKSISILGGPWTILPASVLPRHFWQLSCLLLPPPTTPHPRPLNEAMTVFHRQLDCCMFWLGYNHIPVLRTYPVL